ncbi:MAG: hypothetical protein R3C32_00430 [Chloroflexota bacterium]
MSALAAVAMLVLLVVQSSPVGAAGTRWGSKLNTNLQPSNGSRYCDDDGSPHPICSWMFRAVLDRPGGQKAPKDGYVSKVRLIACAPGSLYLQFGKIRKNPNDPSRYQAKVRRTSAKVSFHGDADCNAPYSIETINIPDVYVHKGEYFGVRAKNPKALRCFSGSPNVLEFDPALSDGGSYRNPDDTNGCFPTIELEYRP